MDGDGKIDPASPYYLSSGDQPGIVITDVLLRGGNNYMAWARAMQLSLQSRRKFVFVNGTITQPTEKEKQLDWVTVNSMLVSWMLRSMEPKIASSIPYHDNAKKLWDFLAKKYCIANGPRLQQLRSEITTCKQAKGMSMEDYYATLIGLYDELVQLKPLSTCDCGNCTCNMAGKVVEDRDEEIFHQFLIGVDDELYATVKLWDFLAKKYCIANGPRLQQLRSEITTCKQAKGMSMEDYYTTLMGLYDELVQFKPLSTCECGNCTCNMAGKVVEDRDGKIFHQFLIGVDDELYATVRTNLLSRVPMPSLDEAYLAFVQEENSRGIANIQAAKDSVQTQSIFAIQADRPKVRFEKPDKSQLTCTHCKRDGHDNSSCFKLHGYLEWYEEMRSRRARGVTTKSTNAPMTAAHGRGIPARANAITVGTVGENKSACASGNSNTGAPVVYSRSSSSYFKYP
ncbi:uncharacterized protein [Spinacia oleracea]|uniref:Retrotransposon Copia-like N-terminal domain-containing protein n=1 Tax=Spinacia oleracea TaxID=3562 RepID=A0ABM3QRY0_SPIOL|nr:uncharacterized protein LOC130461890 [Spinacia oleracea]